MVSLSSAQIRTARAMLGWSMTDLSKAAKVSVSSVKRFEQPQFFVVRNSTFMAIQKALEMAGIVFLDDDGDGSGLRLQIIGAL